MAPSIKALGAKAHSTGRPTGANTRIREGCTVLGNRSCYVAAAIIDWTEDADVALDACPRAHRLDGNEHPTTIWINMFRQAKVVGHEHRPAEGRHFIALDAHHETRPIGFPAVQSIAMDISLGDVYRCRDNLVTREIVGETIIVPISGELAELQNVFSLNTTGAFVWQRLDGSTTLEGIRDAMTDGFKVNKKSAWADLQELIADLVEAGLIEEVA